MASGARLARILILQRVLMGRIEELMPGIGSDSVEVMADVFSDSGDVFQRVVVLLEIRVEKASPMRELALANTSISINEGLTLWEILSLFEEFPGKKFQ